MNVYSDTELVSKVILIAQQAAEKINIIRHSSFKIEIKKDSSPVTEADQAAEKIILTALKTLTPSIPIIAEEEMSTGKRIETGSEFWLVDPLDGTRGFIKKSNNFTVNIGLIRNYKPVLGVVACPAYQEIFYGIVGHGAWKIDKNNQTSPIHVNHSSNGFRILTSSARNDNPKQQKFLKLFPIASINDVGSAIKIIHIAEGLADLHPRFNRTMEWDTAAPQAILEAAGGILHDFNNQPLRYKKPHWENHDFFCASTPIDSFLNQFNTIPVT